MTIQNSTDFTFSPSAQQEIRNAMANCGINKVVTRVSPTDGNNGTQFDLYDVDENYQFSIDTNGDVVYSK